MFQVFGCKKVELESRLLYDVVFDELSQRFLSSNLSYTNQAM